MEGKNKKGKKSLHKPALGISRNDMVALTGETDYRRSKVYFDHALEKFNKVGMKFITVDECSEYTRFTVEEILKTLGRI